MFKTIKKLILIIILSCSYIFISNADDLFTDTWELPYCDNNDCWYEWWVQKVKEIVENAETNKTLSEYIQDIVIYIIWFISLIAVIYIIYAWFRILVWGGSDDSIKNSRKTILHVVIWIILIWLAWSIVEFIIKILNESSSGG